MRIADSSEYHRMRLIPPTETENLDTLEGQIIDRIKQVYDPEIPVNLYDLGLIYMVKAHAESGTAVINMTLTSPSCPEAQSLPQQVQAAAEEVEGINDATVNIVWEPRWDKDRMSDEAKLALGLL